MGMAMMMITTDCSVRFFFFIYFCRAGNTGHCLVYSTVSGLKSLVFCFLLMDPSFPFGSQFLSFSLKNNCKHKVIFYWNYGSYLAFSMHRKIIDGFYNLVL